MILGIALDIDSSSLILSSVTSMCIGALHHHGRIST